MLENPLKMGKKEETSGRATEEGSVFQDQTLRPD